MHWLYFGIALCTQIGVLSLVVQQQGTSLALKWKQLVMSGAIGLVFGVTFDLVLGYWLGIFSYALGFSPLFLIFNGFFAYGLFFATVYALRRASFRTFYVWSVGIGFICEFVNMIFPVWTWHFASSFLLEETVILFAAYMGLMLTAAALWRLVARVRFRVFLNMSTTR
jgi:hypothetical protein